MSVPKKIRRPLAAYHAADRVLRDNGRAEEAAGITWETAEFHRLNDALWAAYGVLPWWWRRRVLLLAAVVLALAVVVALTGCTQTITVTGKYQATLSGWYYLCDGPASDPCTSRFDVYRVSHRQYEQAQVGQQVTVGGP